MRACYAAFHFVPVKSWGVTFARIAMGNLLAHGDIALGKEAACSESKKAGSEGTGKDAQRAQKLASIAGEDKAERALLGTSP